MDKNDYKRTIDHLRCLVDRYATRFEDIEEGYYLAFDDGTLDGGWNDAGEAHKQAERACSMGSSCTIIRVGKRYESSDDEEW